MTLIGQHGSTALEDMLGEIHLDRVEGREGEREGGRKGREGGREGKREGGREGGRAGESKIKAYRVEHPSFLSWSTRQFLFQMADSFDCKPIYCPVFMYMYIHAYMCSKQKVLTWQSAC